MNPLPRASSRLRGACLVLATTLLGPALVVGGASGAAADPADQPRGTAVFQIASFNLLGAGHTDGPKAPRKKFKNSKVRLGITKRIIDSRSVDVVGFQEMHYPQAQQWTANFGDEWATFPGTRRGADPGRFSLSWNKSVFEAVKLQTIKIPYFKGQELPMPYVLLRHRGTGQEAWFINVHNPANTQGDATRFRAEAVRREGDLINRLSREDPGTPVFLTGDMNDRDKFFCPMVRRAPVIASAGGYRTAQGGCRPPGQMDVDWIVSTKENSFTSHTSLRDAQVSEASDHPFIVANANILAPRVRSAATDRVLVIGAAGLGGRLLRTHKGATPVLHRLMGSGASTTSARTAPETTLTMPNLVTMLTGRRVARADGGHGVTGNSDTGGTVHSAAGQYTSSVFDLTHNHGMRTAFYSAHPRSALIRRTWDGAHGGGDPFGPDNGRDKIDVDPVLPDDGAVASRVAADLRANPARLTVVELTGLAAARARSRYGSKEHVAALRTLDQRIGAILAAVNNTPALANTMVVVAGTTGASKEGDSPTVRRQRLQEVPLLVRGPGVPRGEGLYTLNPESTYERTGQGRYDGTGPVMVGATANLVTAALKLPPIPGSQVNTTQRLNVLPLD